MPGLTDDECYFLKQMLGLEEGKLLASRPQLSEKRPFTEHEKRAAVEKLIAEGYLSGEITDTEFGTPDYEGVFGSQKQVNRFKLICGGRV